MSCDRVTGVESEAESVLSCGAIRGVMLKRIITQSVGLIFNPCWLTCFLYDRVSTCIDEQPFSADEMAIFYRISLALSKLLPTIKSS